MLDYQTNLPIRNSTKMILKFIFSWFSMKIYIHAHKCMCIYKHVCIDLCASESPNTPLRLHLLHRCFVEIQEMVYSSADLTWLVLKGLLLCHTDLWQSPCCSEVINLCRYHSMPLYILVCYQNSDDHLY